MEREHKDCFNSENDNVSNGYLSTCSRNKILNGYIESFSTHITQKNKIDIEALQNEFEEIKQEYIDSEYSTL